MKFSEFKVLKCCASFESQDIQCRLPCTWSCLRKMPVCHMKTVYTVYCNNEKEINKNAVCVWTIWFTDRFIRSENILATGFMLQKKNKIMDEDVIEPKVECARFGREYDGVEESQFFRRIANG